MSAQRIMAEGGAAVQELMARAEQRLREVGAVQDQAAATIAAGGKRLRPLLVFLAGGQGGDELVRAAVAVELVHSATLVHDDVLDRAPLRRGQETVFSRAGREAAMETGDLLFSRAFAELAQSSSQAQLAVLSAASSALARGELMQREDAWRADVDEARYLRRCELKTASLFEAACRLGSLAGEDRGAHADALGAFGHRVGIAFQLLDDVLDVLGPEERIGKRRGTDLLDGTATLPLLLARGREPELAALNLRSVRTADEAERVCDLVAASGATAIVQQRAGALVAAAKASLPARLEDSRRHALELLADGVVERYS